MAPHDCVTWHDRSWTCVPCMSTNDIQLLSRYTSIHRACYLRVFKSDYHASLSPVRIQVLFPQSCRPVTRQLAYITHLSLVTCKLAPALYSAYSYRPIAIVVWQIRSFNCDFRLASLVLSLVDIFGNKVRDTVRACFYNEVDAVLLYSPSTSLNSIICLFLQTVLCVLIDYFIFYVTNIGRPHILEI